MNILPLVITFLIIFSCIAATFFKEVKSYFLVESTLEGYHRTQRTVGNAIAQKAYKKIKSDTPAQKGTGSPSAPKTFTSRRTFYPPLENSKFNLSSLVKEEGELALHPLYEPLAAFIHLLYQHCLLSKQSKKEGLEYKLLDALLKKARQNPNVVDLSELYPDDPQLQRIYYKMLKGTNQYSREEGIPPLADFLSLKKGGKAVNLSFASPALLEALFGPKITTEILKKEEEKREELHKYYYFSKEDLQESLAKNPSTASLLNTLASHLDYSKNFVARERVGGRDNKTGIGVTLSHKQ